MNRRDKIIEMATKLFAEKGYYATTMQEIANHLSIAKGSLYAEFKSKDDLLFSIREYYVAQMFEKVEMVQRNHYLNAEEVFIRQIHLQFEDFLERRDFIKLQMTDPTIKQNMAKIDDKKSSMLDKVLSWQYKAIHTTFGDEVRPYIWELVFIFNGILKEFISLIIVENVKFDLYEASVFIAARLKSIVQSLVADQPPTVLPAHIMEKHFQINVAHDQSKPIEIEISDELGLLSHHIQTKISTDSLKEQLIEGINILEEELESKQSRITLVRGILLLLKELLGENEILQRLEYLLKKKFGSEYNWNI